MAYLQVEEKKTLIIPVTKTTKPSYSIEVTDVVWNALQLLIIEGGEKKNITIEFDYLSQTKGGTGE